jgi:hypothetical protein
VSGDPIKWAMDQIVEFRDSLAPPRYGWNTVDVPAQGYVHGLDPAEEDPRRAFYQEPE